MNSVLVTGGTGTLGHHITVILRQRGFTTSILTSSVTSGEDRGTKIVTGDVRSFDTLPVSVQDAETIVHCASNPRDFDAVDIRGTENLIRHATEGRCRHFVFISIVGVDKSDYPYYRAKLKAETLVQNAGLPFTIIRLTQFHEFVEKRILEPSTFDDATLLVPAGLRFQSIAASDAAAVVCDVIGQPFREILIAGGPEILTLEDMANGYLFVKYKQGKLKPVQSENAFHNIFRSGINICADHRRGTLAWKDYLSNHPA